MSDEPHIDYFNMGPWPIYVGFTMDPNSFRLEMGRLGIDPLPDFTNAPHASATTHCLRAKDGGETAIITMRKPYGGSREQVAALIAHEATHVAQQLWSNIGEDRPGREAEAYLVQMIVQCCLQIAWKTNRVRKSEP